MDGIRDLLERAANGDEKAMNEVPDTFRPQLERLASRYADPVRPLASTNDLLQESCVRAWQGIDSFEGGETDEDTRAMFRAWMAQIVRSDLTPTLIAIAHP